MTHAPNVVSLLTTAHDRKFEPAGRLAAAIIELHKTQSPCTPDDLRSHGFRDKQLANNWHLAMAIARIELKLSGGGCSALQEPLHA